MITQPRMAGRLLSMQPHSQLVLLLVTCQYLLAAFSPSRGLHDLQVTLALLFLTSLVGPSYFKLTQSKQCRFVPGLISTAYRSVLLMQIVALLLGAGVLVARLGHLELAVTVGVMSVTSSAVLWASMTAGANALRAWLVSIPAFGLVMLLGRSVQLSLGLLQAPVLFLVLCLLTSAGFWWLIVNAAHHGNRPYRLGTMLVERAHAVASKLDGLFGRHPHAGARSSSHDCAALLRATRPQGFGLFWRLCVLQCLLPALFVMLPAWLSSNALQPGELLTFSFWLSALGVAPAVWWGMQARQHLRPSHLRASGDAHIQATRAAAQLDRTWAGAISMCTAYMLFAALWMDTINVPGMSVALQILLITPSFVLIRVMPERAGMLFKSESIVMSVAALLALPVLLIPVIAPERTEWLLIGPLCSAVIAWFTRWSWFTHLQRAGLKRL